MLSSTAIWTLIQDGTLNLDDRPSKFLSWWTTNTTDPRGRVTLSMLLSFTSGFNGDYNCPGLNQEQCAQAIYDNGTFTEPGTAFHYTGDHLQIAGVIAYKAGGYTNWANLFTARLKTPTGTLGSVSWGFTSNPRVAGGLTTSAESYASMMMGFYLGTVVNQTTIARMQVDKTPSPGIVMDYRPPGIGDGGYDWHYCASFWYECPYAPWNSTCFNNRFFSSPGAFGFYPAIDRVNDFWMVLAPSLVSPAVTIDWSNANRGLIVSILNQVAPLAPAAAPTGSLSSPPSGPGLNAPGIAPSSAPVALSAPTTGATPAAVNVPVSNAPSGAVSGPKASTSYRTTVSLLSVLVCSAVAALF
jgi:CubicO group peptidase (beta-lactamase class C family)